jgi:hypothetical protein
MWRLPIVCIIMEQWRLLMTPNSTIPIRNLSIGTLCSLPFPPNEPQTHAQQTSL